MDSSSAKGIPHFNVVAPLIHLCRIASSAALFSSSSQIVFGVSVKLKAKNAFFGFKLDIALA
jgi:hypothetical protein